ncbi:hypothetical protein CEUSTIGMA_g8946.t1 [Chlamydomonas eustigma]|uniref:Uncharacterized protein n=1 Tax=Chlamydomonas eustigma TaxID=1157962 RepID=A0A250XEK5_9CHLO|nr:hypothetical protein CEUSTIGMA_g8946.t1 [Chlamydomonas eustigma]|eukprot:GAX81518.1 hypothetical protein CEUSTIGMA_g8946.t1 [Chlamydomonas eustigma]
MTRIFAGCYERFLFGFQLSQEQDDMQLNLERKYTFAAHKQAVKCVAGHGSFIASGGTDDTIHLYDIQSNKDLGFLMNPGEGAVPCIKFYAPSPASAATHMFSGSADGTISVWCAGGGWEHLKTLKGHTASVNDVTIHPSGRLALSVSRDKYMRMWNLVKGHCPYTAKLELEGEAVLFSPNEEDYSLLCGSQITVHNAAGEGSVLATLPHPRRALCFAQPSSNIIMSGVEDGSVKVWDLRSGSCIHSLEHLHNSRVRGLLVLNSGVGEGLPHTFASASSDGTVKVWDSRRISTASVPECVASASTNARITCLCAVPESTSPTRLHAAPAAKNSTRKAAVHKKSKDTVEAPPLVRLSVETVEGSVLRSGQSYQVKDDVQSQVGLAHVIRKRESDVGASTSVVKNGRGTKPRKRSVQVAASVSNVEDKVLESITRGGSGKKGFKKRMTGPGTKRQLQDSVKGKNEDSSQQVTTGAVKKRP